MQGGRKRQILVQGEPVVHDAHVDALKRAPQAGQDLRREDDEFRRHASRFQHARGGQDPAMAGVEGR